MSTDLRQARGINRACMSSYYLYSTCQEVADHTQKLVGMQMASMTSAHAASHAIALLYRACARLYSATLRDSAATQTL